MARFPKRHPMNTPLEEWPSGWLTLETGSLLNEPLFLIMRYDEKLERGYPATEAEMRAFIAKHRAEVKG